MYLLRIQITMRQGLSSKYRMFGERRESVTFQNDKNSLFSAENGKTEGYRENKITCHPVL